MGLAVASFALAQGMGGSGFIACFVGGLAFGARRPDRPELLRAAEGAGDVLSLFTWVYSARKWCCRSRTRWRCR